MFIVAQTGTKVMEDKNIGTLGNPLRRGGQLSSETHVSKIIDICNQYGIMLKQHNTDYLDDKTLSWMVSVGIHSANVAPEYGVIETKAFINILEENNLDDLLDSFFDLAYNSNKWQKWTLPNTKLTDREKATLCGHYIFATKKFLEIKKYSSEELAKKSISLNDILYSNVKKSIKRFMDCFQLGPL